VLYLVFSQVIYRSLDNYAKAELVLILNEGTVPNIICSQIFFCVLRSKINQSCYNFLTAMILPSHVLVDLLFKSLSINVPICYCLSSL